MIRDCYPLPTVEDTLHKLQGSKYFAKLDARKGFYQIPLSEESRNLTSFITNQGTYRFTRVPFGLASAPEAYMKVADTIFSDLEGVVSYMDDTIVHAPTMEDLEKRLQKVFQRCREKNLKLNKDKLEYGLTEVQVLGHVVTQNGIKPDPKKVNAILEAPVPKNVAELRSFLRTCGYLQKFIPNYANICEPLRHLVRSDVKWNWDKNASDSFQKLKEQICKDTCLAYYQLGNKTSVMFDASPVGIGAILWQKQSDGTTRPVAFASRSLTQVERRYSQIEREALGCVWAVQHFRKYLWWQKFDLLTDHKPLMYMFNL